MQSDSSIKFCRLCCSIGIIISEICFVNIITISINFPQMRYCRIYLRTQGHQIAFLPAEIGTDLFSDLLLENLCF